MWPVYPPHKTQKPTTPSRFVIPLLGGETTHIAPTYEGHQIFHMPKGRQVFRLGTSESTKGWEWMTWGPCAMKNQRVRGIRADIFFSLPLVTNNRRSNLEKVSLVFLIHWYNCEDFVILFGLQESGMPKEFKNSWDECSKLKCAHRQNQLTN